MPQLHPITPDLLAFLHGTLLFLVAGTLEFARMRRPAPLRWGWLTVAAILHGVAAWGLALKYGTVFSPWLQFLCLSITVASLCAAFEFARRNVPHLAKTLPPLLSHVLLTALSLSGGLLSQEALSNTLRASTLFTGCLAWYALHRQGGVANAQLSIKIRNWSALTYLLTQVGTATSQAWSGVLPPPPGISPHSISLLLEVASLIALLASLQVTALHRDDGARFHTRRIDRLYVALFPLGALLAAYLTTTIWEARETARAHEATQTYMLAFRENINGITQRTDTLAEAGSSVADLSFATRHATLVESKLQRVLTELCRPLPESRCSLLAGDGTMISSSSYDFSDSLERQVLGYREYFLEALIWGKGSSFHIGVVNHRPAYFSAKAIPQKDGTPSVLVVKTDLSGRRFHSSQPLEVFLVNQENQVILSDSSWHVGRPLFPSPKANPSWGIPVFSTSPDARRLLLTGGRTREVHMRETGSEDMRLVIVTDWVAGPARAVALGMIMLMTGGLLTALIHQAKLRSAAHVLKQTKEAEQRLLAIVNSTPDYIGIATLSGDVVYLNPAAQLIFPHPCPADAKYLESVFPNDTLRMLREIALPAALTSGFWTGEATIRRGDNEEIPVSQTIIVHRSESGEPRFLSTIIRDLSTSKQMERERERMQAQLFHAGKLASIGTLAAGIAHEINNPLAIILGFVRVMEAQLFSHPEPKAFLDILSKQERAVARISAIVNGLKSFARIDSSESEHIDVHAAIRESADLLTSLLAKENIALDLQLNASQFEVAGVTGKLQQVLVNLLTNARDALEGQPIKQIGITTRNEPDSLVIEVHDTGSGIPQDLKDRVFDPFFTTKDPGKGTGLGLSISHSIVASMGGHLTADSELGQGSTFSVRIPLAHSTTEPVTPAKDL